MLFNKLTEILDHKALRSFHVSEMEMSDAKKNKGTSGSFVNILYNQKLICSFLSAFGKIIKYLGELSYSHLELL